ncbi:hypothetical protein ACLOJK_024948 [Asimina triloba]
MAEAALSAFLQVIFEKTASAVLKEFGLFKDLHKDIENLRSSLSTILGVLTDAEERQQKDVGVKDWLKKLKDAAYDAENILDQCRTEALRRKFKTQGRVTKKFRDFFSASNPVLFDLRMAHKIKDIRERLHDIAEERSKFHLREGVCILETKGREKTDSFVTESDVFGRNEDKEKVVEVLLNAGNDEQVSVFPVLGIGGLGKTTLAQQVYNDARMEGHFNLKIWVCVSDEFDVATLTKAILENATNSKSDFEDVDVLQRRLREHLRGKKFLLVLDDVWEENRSNWERLRGFLQAGETGSKIIVTTRSDKVASIMGTLPPHHLARLSDEDCWSVFKQRAFGQGRQENINLVNLGKEIVKKCSGVPLIAKALGGLMYFKEEEREWRSVKENEIWNVLEEDGRTLLVLKLSYYHLPPQLKQCFAYCSAFPKDYQIYKEELVLLWMAEGIIQPQQGSTRGEDIGRECFNNLLWRSFFQDVERNDHGNVESCKMHVIMHHLSQSVSGDACPNPVSENSIPNGCRHLSFANDSWKAVSAVQNASGKLMKLRTLRSLGYTVIWPHHDFSMTLPLFLRVLDLGFLELRKDMLNSISRLKQLRFLHLSFLDSIPASFTKLHNLQTLRLTCCWNLTKLPKDMRKMTSLRHLKISPSESLTRTPANMGELKFLQTLSVFIVSEESGCNIQELKDLNLQGEISIRKLENVKSKGSALEAKLNEKADLQTLGLSWSNVVDANLRDYREHALEGLQPHQNLRGLKVENYVGARLPHWMSYSCLPNLVRLSLISCKVSEGKLPALGQFQLLKYLDVSGMDAVKCIDSDFYGEHAFPLVEELILEDMANLEEWSGCSNDGQEAVLPRLKSLTVSGCPKLTAMPCFPLLHSLVIKEFWEAESLPSCLFQSHTNLSQLEIKDCPKLESLSRELANLAALEELHICGCHKLVVLFPEGIPKPQRLQQLHISDSNGLMSLSLQGFTSLTSLRIETCRNLASFVDGMHHHTALENLEISGCPELGSLLESVKHLTSLKSLLLGDSDRVTCLPEGLKHATWLQHLGIIGLQNLAALPDWIGRLSSLQSLYISTCPNLVSLPSGLQQLRNLQNLIIEFCLPLEKRCKAETGEDWHKISRIPHIRVVGLERQSLGRLPFSKSRCLDALIPTSWICQ